ncbi:MAG: ABC transporter permease subunit [Salinivirgaceae bacterium]|jgi:ABC-2 type transport system permease protein|nr:ABC transporter permease subunit [Salinivirgaceae bacterium]
MRQIWVITKRELSTFFNSLMAYIMLIAFLGFSGFFTWISGNDVFFMGQASMKPFFSVAYWTLFFFIPALTMRMLAEEKRSGTIEMLITKPVSDWQIIMGKFLSILILIGISLVLTLPYYITIWNIGPIDHGAVWTGYLGLLLMSASYISIGLFTSSITNNQIVAFLLALLIGVFFHIIFDVLANSTDGLVAQLFNYLSLSSHYSSVTRGVVDSRDLIYFGSLIVMGLIATETALTKRNITR